jgi:hypothetical protein
LVVYLEKNEWAAPEDELVDCLLDAFVFPWVYFAVDGYEADVDAPVGGYRIGLDTINWLM